MAQTSLREEAIRTMAEMIRDIPVAMLTTITPRGWLRSRPMVAQAATFDGELWFFTNRSAAKAADVRDRHQVNVSYADVSRNRYVSVAGMATLVDDRDKARAMWTGSLSPWFPKGLDDPDVILIRIEPEEGEYWDPAVARMVRIEGLREAKAGFRDMESDAGI